MPSVTPDIPKAPRSRNARGQGAQLRDDLLDATLAGLASTGDPEDVSIRSVAKSTGVSPTAVYQHFADRDELLEAACERAFEQFTAHLLADIGDLDDPFDRLAAAGRSYLGYATADPGLYRVLFSNPLHLAANKEVGVESSAGSSSFGVLVDMVQACLDAGAPGIAPVGEVPDATYLSFQVWAWLHGIVDLNITHQAMPWPPAEQLVGDVQRVLGLGRPTG